MQLGLSTYSFPWAIGVDDHLPAKPLKAIDLLYYTAAKQICYVQFGDNMPLHVFSQQYLKNLKDTSERLNINLQIGTKRLTDENILVYLAIAANFNSSFLRVVIDDAGFTPDEQQVIETIKKLLPKLKETGICLALENHDRFPATTLRRIIEQTDSQSVGICLDTANSLGANEGINEVLQILVEYTVNVHIKDIAIKRLSHKMGVMVKGCAAGKGILNIPAIIDRLKSYNKCKTLTLEVWSQPRATLEQIILNEKKLAETSIDYLKNLLT